MVPVSMYVLRTVFPTEVEKNSFYEALLDLVNSVPRKDKIILLGDFNAWVGYNWEAWGCLGRYGTGKMNGNGQLCAL